MNVKTGTSIVGTLALVLLGPGCAADTGEGEDPELENIELSCSQIGPEEETDVHRFSDFGVVSGAEAELERHVCGHEVEEETRELPRGHVAAMFYVVFNAPENCTNGIAGLANCTTPDLDNPATEASILWADGAIVDSYGRAEFEADIRTGLSGAPGEVLFGPGLTDVGGSEVHYLTRDKGVQIPGRVEEQKRTFNGGCDVATCANAQFAIFMSH
jgi:hypothetical protein